MDWTSGPPERPPGTGTGAGSPRPGSVGQLRRSHPLVRETGKAWRRLTSVPDGLKPAAHEPPGRTLIACSGGADSSALAAALTLVAGPHALVMGHVVHDLRPRADALADRDAAAALAERLGIAFVQREVRVGPGNAEAGARRQRYAALAEMARASRCGAVATAHHAGDQLESLLMALMRGAGLDGMRGIAARRRLTDGVWLVRPMLGVRPELTRRACTLAGIAWREDATNADVSRLRAALRARVVPEMLALRPGAAERAADTARLMAHAAALVREQVRRLRREPPVWSRDELRKASPIVLGALIRDEATDRGRHGRDRLSARIIGAIVRAVRDGSTDPRRFELAGGGLVIVTAREVRIERAPERPAPGPVQEPPSV
ncbi:MAG: tRNA lysidine(34) synthetase TilS [Planctomycetota bacterium]|nr:tRNA lysidine(34) synthetase TilS [Planctomycetota bacterium]